MNNGAPSQPQQRTQEQMYNSLVKPAQIANLPHLRDDIKERYRKGCEELWAALRANPQGSEAHQQAFNKLRDVSQKLSAEVKAWRQTQAQQQANNMADNAGMNGPQAHTQPQVQNPQAQAQPSQQDFPPHIKAKVDQIPWFKPPSIADGPDAEHWLAEAKRRYATWLRDGERNQSLVKNLEAMFKQLETQGKEIPEEMRERKANAEAEVNKIKGLMTKYLQQLHENRKLAGLGGSSAVANLGAQAPQGAGAQGRPQVAQPGSQLNQQGRMNAAGQPMNVQGGQQIPQQGQFAGRPQPNPNQAAQLGNHQTNSPQTAHPQSSVPQAYTHEAAVAAASRSYTNPPQGQGQGTPGSATPTHGQNIKVEHDRLTSSSNKDHQRVRSDFVPTPPAPVTMGPSRPTMMGNTNGPMGMVGQPVIQKPPNFLLQGPGDRVLDKKKLDELVRQITGGVDPTDGETLQPEVEESILQLADEFVDNVVTSACKLAKLRGSAQLEIRDLQLVIERQYNIRIPGFASDEIRTVRKVQPSASYLHKMNAVQAAKVMGGTKEA